MKLDACTRVLRTNYYGHVLHVGHATQHYFWGKRQSGQINPSLAKRAHEDFNNEKYDTIPTTKLHSANEQLHGTHLMLHPNATAYTVYVCNQ